MRKILSLVLGLMWVLPVWAGASSDYTKLEYIESTGTQYIDTGYKFSAGNKFEVVLNPLDNIQTWFFGANSGGGEVLFSNGSIYFGTFRPSTTSTSGFFPTTNTIYKITGDMRGASSNQSSLLIDDNLIWQGTGTFNNRKIYLFAYIPNATNESSLGRSKIRIYGFKIWQNDTIVQDLIPVKRHSDGVICMYDMVTGEFFENIGTGTFVAGPVAEIKIATTKYNESAFGPLNTALANAISVVDTVVSNTITQAGRIATLQAQKQTRPNDIADDSEKCPAGKKCLLVEDASGIPHWYEIVENAWDLPVGYTQLQWIESTGEQYLDLGYAISKTMSFEIKSRCLGTAFVFGGRVGSSSAVSGMNYDASGSRIGIRMGSVILFDTLVWQEGTDYTVSIQNGNVSIDGRTVSSATYGDDYYTGKAYLFGVNNNGNVSQAVYNKNRIYYFKMYNNNTLTQNLIPAKNSSGVVGMYDTVSGTFFTNAGTGEFIAGDPVSE